MWKYNETGYLPGNSIYHSSDELYHYGVLGMRWHNRKAKLQAYNNTLVKQRRAKASANVTKLRNSNASANKINKARLKADKINRSKYGQTRGQILAKGLVRNLGANIIGGTAYKTAVNLGNKKAAKYIAAITAGYTTANTAKTVYKMATNYNKPTKKSGTRMSYR